MTEFICPVIGCADRYPFIPTFIAVGAEIKERRCESQTENTVVIPSGGSFIISCGETEFHAGIGSVIAVPAGTSFTLKPESEEKSTAGFVRFTGSFPFLTEGSVKLRSGIDSEEVSRLFAELVFAAKETVPHADQVSGALYALLCEIGALIGFDADFGNSAGIIREAIRQMDRHYDEDITLERLAAISGVSEQHFCRVFKANMGMRPMEYLSKRRMEQAKLLLSDSDMKINEIAQAVGFEDQNYFGITFRKLVGVTPTDYRKLHFGE